MIIINHVKTHLFIPLKLNLFVVNNVCTNTFNNQHIYSQHIYSLSVNTRTTHYHHQLWNRFNCTAFNWTLYDDVSDPNFRIREKLWLQLELTEWAASAWTLIRSLQQCSYLVVFSSFRFGLSQSSLSDWAEGWFTKKILLRGEKSFEKRTLPLYCTPWLNQCTE